MGESGSAKSSLPDFFIKGTRKGEKSIGSRPEKEACAFFL
jgi:hypothetical protein